MLTMSTYSIVYRNGGCVTVPLHCSFVCISAGELAHWFSSNQALSHPRYELEQLSELQQVLHSRENELARKEDLLARKEEELVAMVTQLKEQSGRVQRLEHERSSEERRRRKLEQAEQDLVSGRGQVVLKHGMAWQEMLLSKVSQQALLSFAGSSAAIGQYGDTL